jgi:hypothetical protein
MPSGRCEGKDSQTTATKPPYTAVIVVSCDKYRDLWNPCFSFLFRYWPDCPFPIYLVSNFEKYDSPRVKTVLVGKDRNWSSNLARALSEIDCEFVLVLMEDYFLDHQVNTARILSLAQYMRLRRAACLRLLPSPGPDFPSEDNPEVGEIRKGAPYRLSLQAAIWDRSILLRLLRWGENAWELEVLGSRRTDKIETPFLSVQKSEPAMTYENAVVKGRWDPEAIEFCKRENMALELGGRPIHHGQPFPAAPFTRRLQIAFHNRVLRRLRKSP